MTDFLFDGEKTVTETESKQQSGHWKVLIIDDEPDIHQITKLVLSNFEVEGKSLEFLSAFSAAEGKTVLNDNPDVAVAFVDVVMETNDAGLTLIRWIREELKNKEIRLVLRTGQPGEAPEESIIRDFDINDYKNKTELTDKKLKTLMFSTLRSYRDIQTIQWQKKGLEKIIDATLHFLDCESITEFASSLLSHVASILNITEHQIICSVAVNEDESTTNFDLLASSDTNAQQLIKVPDDVRAKLVEAHERKCSIHESDYFVGYLVTKSGRENYLYVSQSNELSESEHELLEFFAHNLAVAYDNISMREIVKQSQKELSYILGEAVEKRSKETGSHVKRVAHFSYMLALLSGSSEFEADMIRMASPLHDVGKIAIPDRILNKPAKLDKEEWDVMLTHAQVGEEILSQSKNEIILMGAIIAGQHHEKYDGSGYPKGLAGEDIHLAGRITAVADVFDALASDRCYKPAWPIEKVVNLLKEERGRHFDPKLVDLLLDNLDDFLAIRDLYPDLAS